MKSIILPYLFVLSCVFLGSCSSTRMVQSWKAPGESVENNKLSKVLVAVLSTSETHRRTAEDKVVAMDSIYSPSYMVWPDQQKVLDTTWCKQALAAKGFDGILVFTLLDKTETETWVPGSMYGGYWGYHGGYWGGYYDPGYYDKDTYYNIETRLFSIEKNKLLWAGVTSTVDPSSVEKTIEEVVVQVHKQMQKDGFIPMPEN